MKEFDKKFNNAGKIEDKKQAAKNTPVVPEVKLEVKPEVKSEVKPEHTPALEPKVAPEIVSEIAAAISAAVIEEDLPTATPDDVPIPVSELKVVPSVDVSAEKGTSPGDPIIASTPNAANAILGLPNVSVAPVIKPPTIVTPPAVPGATIQVMSPIAWAKKHGKAAQMVYGWLRENKIPATCIYVDPTTQRQFLVEATMDQWYADRQAAKVTSASGPVKTQDPNALLAMMISWFEEAGQQQIADDLQVVLDSKQAAEAPQLGTETTTEGK